MEARRIIGANRQPKTIQTAAHDRNAWTESSDLCLHVRTADARSTVGALLRIRLPTGHEPAFLTIAGSRGQPALEGCAAKAGLVVTSVKASHQMEERGERWEVSHGSGGQPAFDGCAAKAGVVATSVEASHQMGERGHRGEVSRVAGARRSEGITPVCGSGAGLALSLPAYLPCREVFSRDQHVTGRRGELSGHRGRQSWRLAASSSRPPGLRKRWEPRRRVASRATDAGLPATRWNKRPKPVANSYHPSGTIPSRWRIGAK